jgi:hypothetical protein
MKKEIKNIHLCDVLTRSERDLLTVVEMTECQNEIGYIPKFEFKLGATTGRNPRYSVSGYYRFLGRLKKIDKIQIESEKMFLNIKFDKA